MTRAPRATRSRPAGRGGLCVGLCGALALLCLVCACASETSPVHEQPPKLDPPTSFVARARLAHEAAEGATSAPSVERAVSDLVALAGQANEHLGPDDAAAVARDLYGHAAKLAMSLAQLERAGELITRGLSLPGRDPFRVQLWLLEVERSRLLHDAPAEARSITEARGELGL